VGREEKKEREREREREREENYHVGGLVVPLRQHPEAILDEGQQHANARGGLEEPETDRQADV
jgi:hypothetical protein